MSDGSAATDDTVERSDNAGIRFPPPLVFAIALGVGLLLEWLLAPSPMPGIARVLGVVLVAAGAYLLYAFVRAFGRAGTAVEPWEPSDRLVTDGPYRRSRNPGYLGMALIHAGVALLALSMWALATLIVAVAIVDRLVIAREERYLVRRFGDDYREYSRRVGRWIGPPKGSQQDT